MARKDLKQHQDHLPHKQGHKVVKLLEVSPENLNSVLLAIKEDKKLFDLNIRNIINFIFSTYKEPREILSKLKILEGTGLDGLDTIDSIMEILLEVLSTPKKDFKASVVNLCGELYPLSRRITLWYFNNKDLEEEEVEFYLEALERIIFKTGRINFITNSDNDNSDNSDSDNNNSNINDINDNSDSNINDSDSNINNNINETTTNTLNTHAKDLLVPLEDSEEMDRLDKALGIIFKDKQPSLTTSDKQRIAKLLDLLEVILKKHPVQHPIHFRRIIGLVDLDDVLFKKVFRVLKLLVRQPTPSLYAIYAESMHKYRNISRTIDTMQDSFKGFFRWQDAFGVVDLNIVDRSRIPKEEFYSYCLSEQVYLWKIQSLLLYFLRKEDDVKVLESFRDLVNRIEFSDEKLSVIESINDRIKKIKK
ncbi:hypothetical protein NGRA_1325 [Nosema granulosis]|uniref:Uncharacterized protein n=1 Tax=Nosema granulosis TaxID=83296 RepID=A0A9P6GYP6_9MICR|nr:hypothetical protein NGRA_1325 [Nosema granulosis]